MFKSEYLDKWVVGLLRHPINKQEIDVKNTKYTNGFVDFRIALKNTAGFQNWQAGQDFFEDWEETGIGYSNGNSAYLEEIEGDTEIYNTFPLSGDILDVGGLSGTVRHFLLKDSRYVCLDPFENAPHSFSEDKKEAYLCLASPYNFVVGNAEFLPFRQSSFDLVHMRSMLDHVQVPDLAMLEAHRVLKIDGKLLVGMTVEGGKTGKITTFDWMKEKIRWALGTVGYKRFIDHHTWHPTYAGLVKLAEDNGFVEVRHIWQSKWKDRVVYILFEKRG